MNGLAQGRALVCSAYDPSGLISATVVSILRELAQGQPIQVQLAEADTPEQVARGPAQLGGLTLWHISDRHELLPLCRELLRLCNEDRRRSETVSLVFLARELSHHYAAIVESGAQIVVCNVPSLYQVLLATWTKLSLSEHGFHPLTSGLTQRLPWPELDD